MLYHIPCMNKVYSQYVSEYDSSGYQTGRMFDHIPCNSKAFLQYES